MVGIKPNGNGNKNFPAETHTNLSIGNTEMRGNRRLSPGFWSARAENQPHFTLRVIRGHTEPIPWSVSINLTQQLAIALDLISMPQ